MTIAALAVVTVSSVFLFVYGANVVFISLRALRADKSEARDDPRVAAKDRADTASLSRPRAGEAQ